METRIRWTTMFGTSGVLIGRSLLMDLVRRNLKYFLTSRLRVASRIFRSKKEIYPRESYNFSVNFT